MENPGLGATTAKITRSGLRCVIFQSVQFVSGRQQCLVKWSIVGEKLLQSAWSGMIVRPSPVEEMRIVG